MSIPRQANDTRVTFGSIELRPVALSPGRLRVGLSPEGAELIIEEP